MLYKMVVMLTMYGCIRIKMIIKHDAHETKLKTAKTATCCWWRKVVNWSSVSLSPETRQLVFFFFYFNFKLDLLQVGTFLFQNKTGAYFVALCWFLLAFPNFLERGLVFWGGGEGKAGDWCRNPDMMKIVEFCPSQTKHSSWTPKRKHSTCGLQSETDRTGTKSWQSFRI